MDGDALDVRVGGRALRPTRVVIAPDKFKGSLSARAVADHLAVGLTRAAPDLQVVLAPVADGGDGTLDVLAPHGFTVQTVTVTGSTGQRRRARFGIRDADAVLELAEADGLRHIDPRELRPLTATSRGLGELIAAGLDRGCRRFVLGLGGSANTDGGAGMLQALGLALQDAHGRELAPGGAALRSLETIDTGGLDPRLAAATFVVATDVDNPLLGERGAAAVYAPQKGAGTADVAVLESGLRRWSQKTETAMGLDVSDRPGAGAAGGVGFGALAYLNATVRPGIDLILELVGFDELITGASLVITGEGGLDEQSLNGKAPIGVAAAAARRGVPAVAVVGRSSLSPDRAAAVGLAAVYALTDLEPDISVCISDAGRLLEQIGSTLAAELPALIPAAAVART